jgi:hypothetical protein
MFSFNKEYGGFPDFLQQEVYIFLITMHEQNKKVFSFAKSNDADQTLEAECSAQGQSGHAWIFISHGS